MKKVMYVAIKKHLCRCTMVLAMGVFLIGFVGCTRGSTRPTEKPLSLLTHEEKAIMSYVQGENTGSMTEEEYLYLAKLYGDRYKYKDKRDVLEECVLFLDSVTAYEELQTVWINLDEEKDPILKDGLDFYQAMSSDENYLEAVQRLTDVSWLKEMMPRIYKGGRNYFIVKNEKAVMAFRVEYDERGQLEGTIWYPQQDDNITVMKGNEDHLIVLQTEWNGKEYTGPFEMWTLKAENGEVTHESGTFLGDVYFGSYTANIHAGRKKEDAKDAKEKGSKDKGTKGTENEPEDSEEAEPVSIASLWESRNDLEYIQYEGMFDELGRCLLRQKEDSISLVGEESPQNYVVYAYNEELKAGIYCRLGNEDPLKYQFLVSRIGIAGYPEFRTYLPKGELEFLTQRGVAGKQEMVTRLDGKKIQVMLDGNWMTVGELKEYSTKNKNNNGIASGEIDMTGIKVLQTTTPSPKPKETAKPKPRETVKPSETTKPTPVPTPAPTPQPQNNPPAPQHNPTNPDTPIPPKPSEPSSGDTPPGPTPEPENPQTPQESSTDIPPGPTPEPIPEPTAEPISEPTAEPEATKPENDGQNQDIQTPPSENHTL